MTGQPRRDACIDAVAPKPNTMASADFTLGPREGGDFHGHDRPHVLRQAISCCRNSAPSPSWECMVRHARCGANRIGHEPRPHVPMAQTPVQRYLPTLMRMVEDGTLDPSFVVTHTAPLSQGAGALSDVPGTRPMVHTRWC